MRSIMYDKRPMPNRNYSTFDDRKKRTLYIYGFPINTTKEQLAGHFKLWGRVISANVSKDFDKKKTNVDLGYGFVEFATIEEAEEALKFPRQNINGNICEVKLSQSGSNDKWKIPEKPKQAIDIRKAQDEDDAFNHLSQIRDLEECMLSLQKLNMTKGLEIEKLMKEKKALNEKIQEYESLKDSTDVVSNKSKESSDPHIPECSICNENRVEMVFVPCGHCCLCYECSNVEDFNVKTCLICHKEAGIIKMLL